jgi:hypothetical protein
MFSYAAFAVGVAWAGLVSGMALQQQEFLNYLVVLPL